MNRVRCAVYTRKSSEEGLEQGFNSLDAQYEACSAYILSQAGQGWEQIAERYDDGGLSGGTLERPALQRLLADIAAGRLDIIVVYKVDRLTRSLLDFAKLVEAFDASSVSFVSITQSFNTTTSMGRLTLNMLLSFAQFEREVTAERIRDKIAASKAKGMWMGGTPPLGYQPDGRTLAIVEEHAALIRDIYRRYLELQSVRLVSESLERDCIRTPHRIVTKTGRTFGGVTFTRGQLYSILRNPIYVGDIPHHDKVYAGQHPAILDRADWDRVQQLLADHTQGGRTHTSPTHSLLAGKIIDDRGQQLIATHACKGKQRYRYYVSRDVHHVTATTPGMRIPAREIEGLVANRVAALFDDPIALMARAGLIITPVLMGVIAHRAATIALALRAPRPAHIAELVEQVRVEAGRVEIDVLPAAVAELFQADLIHEPMPAITLTADVRLTRTGRVVRLVHGDGRSALPAEPEASLLNLVIKARRWWTMLAEGEVRIGELAAREGVSASWMTRVVRLAFLSPQVIDAALSGTLHSEVDALALVRTDAMPSSWAKQKVRFLPV
ncbi:recombinase family protein [Sphingomonas sp. M1-B02]|uniref:recombinase family protein n=1 Tax=Sphingomonas sp. M1-B02 TaxID=3114300 RepID=UPI00223F5202|nr:recombinase family protein [Sphingomonas sp. S6-11]UZK65435.1 recombinase family protein [Sphingomonas sp. S6-11]